jgi:hypothetical protein
MEKINLGETSWYNPQLVFSKFEKPLLKPLKVKPPASFEWIKKKNKHDYLINYKRKYFIIPHSDSEYLWIAVDGKRVFIKDDKDNELCKSIVKNYWLPNYLCEKNQLPDDITLLKDGYPRLFLEMAQKKVGTPFTKLLLEIFSPPHPNIEHPIFYLPLIFRIIASIKKEKDFILNAAANNVLSSWVRNENPYFWLERKWKSAIAEAKQKLGNLKR